mmetsp:Transcript_7740/g.16963  ORF Transcript_7740/g.16963 Transcript_7740/m.16963 type:complete len:155 (-) Transcript_7740:631-1095(-)
MRVLCVSLLFACSFVLVSAQALPASATGADAMGNKQKPVAKSLFSSLTKSLPQDKRPLFMELMKKMRLTKQMKKEDKKAVIVQLDAEIHKLLGDEYKKYRSVQDEVHKERQALNALQTPPPPPSPPPPAITSSPFKGKKKTGGKGMKKLKPTTR